MSQPTPVADRREILRLAVPALGALAAEPIFLLADSAIVGRLGTVPLAGLGVAGAVLATVVNVFIFLAYATTANVSRLVGAGDRRRALARGVDGLWLAAAIGAAAAALAWPAAPLVVQLFDPAPAAAAQAVSYLRWSLPGVPAMLVVLAATGVLRGLRDTRTTMVVAIAGALANIGLNLLLVLGFRLGIKGAAIGTVLAQLGMAAALSTVVVRAAVRHGAGLRPHALGIRATGQAGVPLLIRTLALRAVLLLTTWVAARQATSSLAAHQVAMNIWTFTALVLDALAIAAQALTGTGLGAGDRRTVRAITSQLVRWGWAVGALLGLVLLAVHRVLPLLFTADQQVVAALSAVLVVLALAQPLAGYVFVLDGVLIGAGDGRFLAVSAIVQTLCFVPIAWAVAALAAPGPGYRGLVWLWIGFAGAFMAVRGLLLGLRIRGDAWLVLGADGQGKP